MVLAAPGPLLTPPLLPPPRKPLSGPTPPKLHPTMAGRPLRPQAGTGHGRPDWRSRTLVHVWYNPEENGKVWKSMMIPACPDLLITPPPSSSRRPLSGPTLCKFDPRVKSKKNHPPKPYLPLQTRTRPGQRPSHRPHLMCKVVGTVPRGDPSVSVNKIKTGERHEPLAESLGAVFHYVGRRGCGPGSTGSASHGDTGE